MEETMTDTERRISWVKSYLSGGGSHTAHNVTNGLCFDGASVNEQEVSEALAEMVKRGMVKTQYFGCETLYYVVR